jgi:hypothetical protein
MFVFPEKNPDGPQLKNTSYRRFLMDLYAGAITLPGLIRLVAITSIPSGFAARYSKSFQLNSLELIGLVVISILCTTVLLWAYYFIKICIVYGVPPCRKGNCTTISDYDWHWGMLFGAVHISYGLARWRWHHYVCRCGDFYVRVGNRFMSSDTEGVTTPYKKSVGFGKWEDDQ